MNDTAKIDADMSELLRRAKATGLSERELCDRARLPVGWFAKARGGAFPLGTDSRRRLRRWLDRAEQRPSLAAPRPRPGPVGRPPRTSTPSRSSPSSPVPARSSGASSSRRSAAPGIARALGKKLAAVEDLAGVDRLRRELGAAVVGGDLDPVRGAVALEILDRLADRLALEADEGLEGFVLAPSASSSSSSRSSLRRNDAPGGRPEGGDVRPERGSAGESVRRNGPEVEASSRPAASSSPPGDAVQVLEPQGAETDPAEPTPSSSGPPVDVTGSPAEVEAEGQPSELRTAGADASPVEPSPGAGGPTVSPADASPSLPSSPPPAPALPVASPVEPTLVAG